MTAESDQRASEADALVDAQGKALAIGRSRTGVWTMRTVRGLVKLLGHPYFKVRVRGAEHLMTPGPLVVAPVHRSNLDAPLLATITKRRLWALGKDSLFKNPAIGWLVSALGSFPVARGTADREAMRAAERILVDGEALIVFPEGTRQDGNDVSEIFDGAAFLAARARAKVVMVGIAGTQNAMPSGAKFPRRTQVALVVSEPLDPPELKNGRLTMSSRKAYSAEIRDRLQSVFTEAQAEVELPL